MVRTREKKSKGDSAFTKRKQKVGRKKLAPATATRAEVHARTLRLVTSTAMSAAMASPHVKDPAAHPASSETTSAGMKDSELRCKRPVISVQSFSELLSVMRHYKAAQRASAFATLTRLLRLQREKDEAAAAVAQYGGVAAASAGSSAFEEHMRCATSTSASANSAGAPSSSAASPTRLAGLSSLERLKSFAAALDVITDTDDDVRREALQSLEVMMDYQWISCERDGCLTSTPSSFLGATSTLEAADLERCNALLLSTRGGDSGRSGGAAVPGDISAPNSAAGTAVDRIQAVLQAVHVALTHALKPVRISGAELLSILLKVAPPSLVRAAARAVCRHQSSYYNATPAMRVASGSAMGAFSSPAATTTSAAGTSTMAALEEAQARAAALLEEEELWMLTLVRRVSSLVLRTEHMVVLPALISAFLGEGDGGGIGSTAGDALASELLHTPSLIDSDITSDVVRACRARGGVDGSSGALWRHPELVNAFFDEVAPQWASHWKELMELRLELLRQDDKLAMASALARSFAVVLAFLKRQQQTQYLRSGIRGSGSVNFFSRNRMHYIKGLFIDKMPVTMQELLLTPSFRAPATPSPTAATAAAPAPSSRAMKARLELGLTLVMVCVPLAGTEEGWELMRDYFSIVFSLPIATPPPSEPFHFPSVALLEMSVRLFVQVMQLYPCVAPNLQVSGGGGAAAIPSRRDTWVGNFSVHLVSRPGVKDAGHHTSRAALGNTASLSASSQPAPTLQRHKTVTERLLFFFPGVLTTVIRHLVPRSESCSVRTSGTASEEVALARVLLSTAMMLERFAALPEDLVRCGGAALGKGKENGRRAASKCGGGTPTAQRLEEGFGLVPRLLFALREQTQAWQKSPAALKRARAEGEEDKDSHLSAAPERTVEHAATPLTTRAGVLLSYNGVVDAMVYRCLRVLWLLSSSGHPLLRRRDTHLMGEGASSPALEPVLPPTSLAAFLAKSIRLLFGSGGVAGVLQRCSAPTVLLAHSTLFYLCGSGRTSSAIALGGSAGAASVAAADTERPPMAEAAEKWTDVLDVLGTLRARVHMDV
ncbi:hypothetical protein LSCM1_06905 [Leishmania martiniquensis]|uniref:Uncharacterized protein n=1 Tax=Leishmania martiniquensis TaxID=1580590 RepID=A0A836KQA5_9TRYP|nr:hypothetical protein LSCM1_06905 [Leishmania martiniquensis]